jgi:hypothetical protein
VLSGNNSGAGLISEAGQATIRNNLFDANLLTPFGYGIALRRNGGPNPDDVAIYNNTFFNNVTSGFDTAIVNITSALTNVVVRNNLGYAPNNTGFTTGPVINSGGASVTQSNNSNGAQIKGTNPMFTTTPPTQPSHWRPTGGSYAIGSGFAVPVFSDFFAAPRTGNHMGAVNP